MPERTGPADGPDLGALLARVFPKLAALEEPILREAGLSMWEYAILTELAVGEAVSQVELSRHTRRDPTRLGRHLDDLASRDLIARARATDQRQVTVRLTRTGRALISRVKQAVREVEDQFLRSILSAQDADRLRRLLVQLAEGS